MNTDGEFGFGATQYGTYIHRQSESIVAISLAKTWAAMNSFR